MENEITKAAEVLGLSVDEVREKVVALTTEHKLDTANETDKLLLTGLFRQWFGQMRRAQQTGTTVQTSGSSLVNNGFGIIVGIEDCRDMMQYQRTQVEAEYRRDSESVYKQGRVALVVNTGNGHQISQWLNDEEITRNKDSDWELPDSAIQIDDKWIILVDNRPSFGSGDKNKNYGKPLPLEQWVRRVHFVGEGDSSGSQYWLLSLKNEIAQDFSAECFRFCHIAGIWNHERNAMYGVRNQTRVTYNDELDPNHDDYRDTTEVVIGDILGSALENRVAALVDLERYHQDTVSLQLSEKLVLTDGVITNMILRPNSTGNRTIFISDLNAEYDYDSGGYSSIACWVPPHINLDFGIGSHVVILGRTNQREVDGELSSVSLNVFGVLVADRRGEAPETDESVNDEDWF
jgi:hypothetical protein